jgi:FAD/FMN-containing dehydrogenase
LEDTVTSAYPIQKRTADRPSFVRLPNEQGYGELVRPFNLTADQRPAFVAAPRTSAEVSEAVQLAADHQLRVAVQRTGHGASISLGDEVALIATRYLDTVEIDADSETATVGAGTLWGTLASTAADAGLVGLAGTASTVGVCGYVLGGGLGWLGRRRGLASSSLIAVDYVDAAGEQRHAGEADDPEALWAFRGGGGVGIVTRLRLQLWPHPILYAGARFWPMEHLPAVVERWLNVAGSFPQEITSMVWAVSAPDAPGAPEPLRGRAVIALGACGTDVTSAQAHLEDCFEPLPTPLFDSFAERRPEQLGEIHLDPPAPVPAIGEARQLADFDPTTAIAIVQAAGIGDGALTLVELRQLGGAFRRTQSDGALTAMDGAFALTAVGAAPDATRAALVNERLASLVREAAPVDLGRSIANLRSGRSHAPGALTKTNARRLQRIQSERDPSGRLSRAMLLTEP